MRVERIKLQDVNRVVKNKNCMGCGICSVSVNGENKKCASLQFDRKYDYFIPIVNDVPVSEGCEVVCPGQSMNMQRLSEQVYGKQPSDPIMGIYEKLYAGYAENNDYREKSASGGAIPAILAYLLQNKLVDSVYCLDANSADNIKDAKGMIITEVDDLQQIHGSCYHPAKFGDSLSDLMSASGRFVFVGLPCHIAGLEMLKSSNLQFKKRHVLSIGLFCGGINTFKGIRYYLSAFKLDLNKAKKINYRVGGWPGSIKLKFSSGQDSPLVPRIRGNSRWKILRYVVAFQGYWMLKRCRLCPDQISDFADIAVGDPHLPRFRKKKNNGWSVIIARSKRGQNVLQKMIDAKQLSVTDISRDEVVTSQGYTLDNRRHVHAYRKVAKLFAMKVPHIVTYAGLDKSVKKRHYVYAFVDLMKVAMPKGPFFRMFYIPWQIFEYLFITFTPMLIFSRLFKLISNKGRG